MLRNAFRTVAAAMIAAALFLPLSACASLQPSQPGGVSQVSATVQQSAITICTAYADALQVAAVLRRAGQLSASAISTIDGVRQQMTPACTSPVTEAGLQSLTAGLAQIVAAMKGGG